MDNAAEIAVTLADEWLPAVYEAKVRSQRTRAINIDVPERENLAQIQYTLLGIELKVGRRRFACPDLAVARYMRVFARLGCRSFALPYDITKVSGVADELETSWQRTLLILEKLTAGQEARSVKAARTSVLKAVRAELSLIGPGDAVPVFDRETRQRARGD